MQIKLVVAVDNDGGGKDYNDHNAIGVAISRADVTPNIATKYAPVLQAAEVLRCNVKLLYTNVYRAYITDSIQHRVSENTKYNKRVINGEPLQRWIIHM